MYASLVSSTAATACCTLATAARTPGLDFSARLTAVEREICANPAVGRSTRKRAGRTADVFRIAGRIRSAIGIVLSLLLSACSRLDSVRGAAVPGSESVGGGNLLLGSSRVALVGQEMCELGTHRERRRVFRLRG